MKNVHLYCAEQALNADVSSKVTGSQVVCVDYASGKLFFLNGTNLFIVEPNGIEHETISLDLVVEVSENSPVVLFDFLMDSSEICLICRSGHVFTYDLMAKMLNERGCIIDKIWGGAWSPDFQALVVATNDLLISISRDFDTIDEVDLFPTHAGKEELQTIGWGSKQTQFQGQAGKANREKLDLDRVPTKIHQWDCQEYSTLVSWRADAQILATSTVEQIGHDALRDENGDRTILGRRIRVWDRNLQLLSCCDILAGIEPVLTLRPGKSIILTSRLFGQEGAKADRSLWFFEQNGQYFRNASLPMGDEAIIKRVQWNADGSILLLVVDYPLLNKDQIQFWMVSNAEWALKSSLDFTDRIADCFFSQEIFLSAYCLTANGRLWKFELNRAYNCEDGIVVSACAESLRFSDFNKAPIPPPMCHSEISLSSNAKNSHEFVTSIALGSNGQLAVLSSQLNLHISKFESLIAKHVKTIGCQHLSYGILYGINWASKVDDCITACFCDSAKWIVYSIENGEFSEIYTSDAPIVYQIRFGDKLFVAETSGVCKMINISTQQIERTFDTKTRSFFSWKLLKNGKLIGLSPRHALMYNEKVILENCTSFSVTSTEDYILASTFSNKLVVLNLDLIGKELTEGTSIDYNVGEGRLIERGATIVGHEPGLTGTKCTLQMPRGNLEQIFPRDLLVERTKTLINRREYRNALKEMRRHRLNMNLIFDHDPKAFLDNISNFVSQFDAAQQLDIDLLQLFITGLEDDDCTITLFAKSYNNSPLVSKNENAVTVPDKVKKVCTMLLEEIKSRESSINPNDFQQIYLVILSCYVKPKSNNVVKALLDLKKRADQYNVNDEARRSKFLSSCLRHLCYSVQESLLFDSALRTYDLNIVSMIADKQQKDPREYLPIIDELRSKTPEEYRNYCVCLRLQDWKMALKHVANVSERFDECLQLIKQHILYVDALTIFKESTKYKEICQVYAEHLLIKTQYRLAAMFFEKCENWEKALKCLELGRLHHEFIQLYNCLDSEHKEKLHKNYIDGLKKMAVLLEQHDQFSAVAEILKTSGVEANLTKICEMCARSGAWSEAIELTQKHKQQKDVMVELLKQRVDSVLHSLSEWCNNMQKQCNRLVVLRDLKAKLLEDWTEARGDVDLGQSETMSEASTVASNMSRLSAASSASSRRRKNVQRKKAVIKEGSQYEDSAILVSLKNICIAVDSLQDEMCQLLPALLSVDLIEEAKQVHEEFDSLISKCQANVTLVWPMFLTPRDLPGPIFETYRGEDGIIRMPESGAMPSRLRIDEEQHPPVFRKNIAWKLNHFV